MLGYKVDPELIAERAREDRRQYGEVYPEESLGPLEQEMDKANEVSKRPPEPPEAGGGEAWEDVYEAEQQFGRIMAELMTTSELTQFVAVAETDEGAARAYRNVLKTWESVRLRSQWCSIMDRVEREFTDYGVNSPHLGKVTPDLLRAIGILVVKILDEQEASARDATQTSA